MANVMARAVVGAVLPRSRPQEPPPALQVSEVTVDRSHLRRYAQVCGFPLTDTLPPTYLHVLAFPTAMDLMTRPSFPFSLLGIVHVQNTITQHRPVFADSRFRIDVRAENLRPHERGRVIDVVCTATVDGAAVWEGRSAYLHKESSSPSASRTSAAAPRPSSIWRFGRDVGPSYARVSGDHNPIHTSRLGARLFGYRRPIAHGMYTKTRCVAALASRLPDAFTVDVAFKLPLALPAVVGFSSSYVDGTWSFGVHGRDGRPHLVGSLTS